MDKDEKIIQITGNDKLLWAVTNKGRIWVMEADEWGDWEWIKVKLPGESAEEV